MSTETKIWTFGEAYDKVREDVDLDEEDPDEQFVKFSEMIGYFNEGIDEAESEIHKINEDYFRTYDWLPLEEGVSEYDLPADIYAQKLRGLTYSNGPLIYPVRKYRRLNQFQKMAEDQHEPTSTQEYRYDLINRGPGNLKMLLIPAARETAILPPLDDTFTPIQRWYLRNANRIPLEGEYTNPEEILPTAVNATANTLTVDPLVTYVTGDEVKLTARAGGDLPSPLVEGTVYYVIAVDATTIKLATSRANALTATAIDLTTVGTQYFVLRVAATTAIIRATVIDIPEFTIFIMEWVKANCLYKDGDSRLAGTVAKLEQQRTQMVDTLTEREPDDDDEIEGDFSAYREMS